MVDITIKLYIQLTHNVVVVRTSVKKYEAYKIIVYTITSKRIYNPKNTK